MRIAILSAGNGWHVRDLQRAATGLGHLTTPVDFRRVSVAVASSTDSLADYDSVIVRTMPPGSLEQIIFRMDVLHRLQANGIPVFNSPRSLEISIDKYHTSARLEAAGLRVPPTIVCQDADTALAAFTALGGDVVVKPLFGSEGRGIVRVSDVEIAWRTFRTLERTQSVLYLQKFIAHAGWDLRVLVLGGRILAAMRRHAPKDWRTNVARGARAETVSVSEEQCELALRAADAVDAQIAGVDLLPGLNGETYVLEVNAVPGWRALSRVTGMDIAQELLRYIADEYRSKSP